MADLSNFVNSDRDIQQALVTLKRGTQLTKYSRKSKPKFRSFRLSTDETTLIWFSRKKEKSIKLSSVQKIFPGQRTPVFGRYPRPGKDHLSFSIIYKNGRRSLDLICKDKAEVEIWFSGLQAVISSAQSKQQRSESNSEGYTISDEGSDSIKNATKIFRTNKSFSKSDNEQRQNTMLRGSVDNNRRISVSSAPSNASSGQEDIESLIDVYIWGEVWAEGPPFQNSDVLTPKPLETDVAMDVHQIACGSGHAALVTRQGDIYTWGQEYAGRLGRGNELSSIRPKPVETPSSCNMEYVACGEFMTCGINVQGDLFTWGDMVHKTGLLGHGSQAGHMIPKQVSGPLEGLQVLFISCGSWHSALVTCNQKLFTFGDGAFGALGHGNRESVNYPKEVRELIGFKTIKVACGLWHTAAIVETRGQPEVNVVSRKLFTWGAGDKHRLGHGDKHDRLVPTIVPSLVDYDFHQVACGDNLTVALTTRGYVVTMGSKSHGQLGNPQADGQIPCFVQDRLAGELVEDISCGSCHVVALTSKNEVYSWGKGSNGRLGHGNVEDKITPTLIVALMEWHVKSIACGSNFTACLCMHKWVPTSDQSLCAGCRQAFGFTRKRHTCYHCGLVHCHACSSHKALKAQLAPVPSKPHRVCDLCFAKLNFNETNDVNTGNANLKTIMTRKSTDKGRSSRSLFHFSGEPVKYPEMKARNEGKMDSLSVMRPSQVQSILQLPTSLTALQTALKPIVTSAPVPGNGASTSNGGTAPTSPYSRRPSPPIMNSLFSKGVIDSSKKINELVNQEVQQLQSQVLQLQSQLGALKEKSDMQEEKMHRIERKAKKAHSMATQENAKCNATLDLIKSFESQLMGMADSVPLEVLETLKALKQRAESILIPDDDHARSSTERPSIEHLGAERNSIDENTTEVHRVSTDVPFKEKQDKVEPGVYVTYIQYDDGSRAFKRIQFSRKRYSKEEGNKWYEDNYERIQREYNRPPGDLPLTPPPAFADEAVAAAS